MSVIIEAWREIAMKPDEEGRRDTLTLSRSTLRVLIEEFDRALAEQREANQ